jgi:hypothetical protein
MNNNGRTEPEVLVGRSVKTLGLLFLLMTVLVATHEGEFWPFSIYPMFSQAGKPWSRAVVRDYSGVPDQTLWDPATIDSVRGEPFALRDHDIEGPDIANFVVKNRDWSVESRNAFRKIFLDYLADRRLMLFRVDGRYEDNRFDVRATPVLLMSSDTTLVNPILSIR